MWVKKGEGEPQRSIQGLGTCAEPLILLGRQPGGDSSRESSGWPENTNSTARSLGPGSQMRAQKHVFDG